MRTQTLLSKNELKQRQAHASKQQQGDITLKKREAKFNEKLQARLDQEKTMSINDFLLEREVKIQNRNSVLQS